MIRVVNRIGIDDEPADASEASHVANREEVDDGADELVRKDLEVSEGVAAAIDRRFTALHFRTRNSDYSWF